MPATALRSSEADPRFLDVYLNDHVAAAGAGVQLARRLARTLGGTPDAPEARLLAREVAEDRAALKRIMDELGVRRRMTLVAAARAAEVAGRFKPNGRLVRRSPLRALIELEGMRLAVLGKLQGWRALLAAYQQGLPVDVDRLRMLEQRAV